MAGDCVEKLQHLACNSRDGLQVFYDKNRDNYTGFCFKCGTYIPDPYSDGKKPEHSLIKKTEEQIRQEIDDIATYPVLDIPERKLKREYLDYFEVKVGVDEADGLTPRYIFFPYYNKMRQLISYKTRVLQPKNMWFIGSGKRLPFGWFQALESGSRKLFITEGEFDAIALFQVLKDLNKGTKYEELNPAVISFPFGATAVIKEMGKIINEAKKFFKQIIYIPDQDDAGLEIVDNLVKTYPTVEIADIPCKDVNDCLIQGKKVSLQKAVLFKSSKPKNTRIIKGSSLIQKAKEKPQWGLDWPWPSMTKATRGIRRGETLYFGAGVKMGKSSLVNALAAHRIMNDGLPVFLCKPEEAVAKSFQKIVGASCGRIFHDPTIEFDEERYDQYASIVGDKAIILDSYQFVDWHTLKDDIRYAVQNEGVKDVFIDPITCLTNQIGVAEANEFLVAMTAELSSMSLDMEFTSYIFCHLKAPTSGDPHERGGQVLSHQFAGSRAMMRVCNYMFGLEGNKDPDKPIEEKNIRDLVILEDREFGSSERVRLYYDWKTGNFTEIEKD